ncbi:pantothenate kinase 4-like isoform X1 [Cryptosporidium felis]|nr:pantothenate kinase 4-like isoform X1 [Cryptosporidium felis]
MGNCLGIEIFKDQVDVCLAINSQTSINEKKVFKQILFEKNLKDYLILRKEGRTVSQEIDGNELALIFIRVNTSDFKKLLLENIAIFQNNIKIAVLPFAGEENDTISFLNDFLGDELKNIEVVTEEKIESFNPLMFLISNFEFKDYLVSYSFKGSKVKTLSIFNCLDEQDAIQIRELNKQKTTLNHFIHIRIGRSHTDFLHYPEMSSGKLVGGIEIGEYTFWGLIKVLNLKAENIEDIKQAISNGDIQNCDLIVKDIYGQSYSGINLHEDSVASSLGKLQFPNDEKTFKSEDLIKSVLILITSQIIQKGVLHSQILQEKNIIISGFVSNFPQIMVATHNTIQALSGDFCNVYFLKPIINLACISSTFDPNSL